MLKSLSRSIKSNWRRTLSGLLAVITIMGMLPAAAFAAEGMPARAAGSVNTPVYVPTGDFEVNIAGATGWNGTCIPLPAYSAESGGAQIAAVPASDGAKPISFAILAYNGGDRVKVGLAVDSSGGVTAWEGGQLGKTGWVDKERIFINLPDVVPSIAYNLTNSKSSIFQAADGKSIPDVTGRSFYPNARQFSSRLSRYEYVVPCMFTLAERLAKVQQSAMSNGETLVIYETFRPAGVQSAVRDGFASLWDSDSGVSADMDKAVAMGYARNQGWFIAKGTSNHQAGLAVDMSLAKGAPTELHEYTLDGSTYRKYEDWTEYEMPTSMHELSSAAIRYRKPVSSYTMPGELDNWTERFAASEGAKRLQGYCTAAGLIPLASEWWHFNDPNTAKIMAKGSCSGQEAVNTKGGYTIDRAYSTIPYKALTELTGGSIRRAPAKANNSSPTGGTGGLNPGSPGGQRPSTSNVAWSTDPERTFLRFTLIEFPEGVVKDINSNDYNTWHVVGTPLNVVWGKGTYENWSAEQCRSKITWFNSCAMQYNGKGADAAQVMAGGTGGVYAYDATSGYNQKWVTTADEFQAETGISDQEKEQMFRCSGSKWSTGWVNGDYTSMWGTDPKPVTPGNLYKVYKPNDAFLYLLGRLSSQEGSSGWSKDDAIKKWSEYVHDTSGNLRTKYRVIIETGGVFADPDGVLRAYTLREMMAYSLYNSEPATKNNLIWDQSSTIRNMAQWMRQKKAQFLEYPLDSSGTPTGEELCSTNGFTEADSFVDSITKAAKVRDTIFSERRSYGLHILSPFNFERPEPTGPSLEVTKKAGSSIPAGKTWGFTVTYTTGAPISYTATMPVTETGNGLKFTLKANETIHIDFVADASFRFEVFEDDTTYLTGITGTGGTADMVGKKFTSNGSESKVTFNNGTEPPPPPDQPDEPDKPTPTLGKAILFKRDANTNKGVGPATFKFSSVVNGVYEFDTNSTGELEPIQWWDPTEAAGKYIKPGEYAVTELVPPPNYEPTTEVQQIKLELDADGNPIPAGPLVFKNLAKVGLRVVKYDRLSYQPMNGVTFEIFKDGASIGWYETKGQGEILLTGIEPGTYRAVEVDTGDEGHILDASCQEVELVAGGGTKELIFFNDNKPGMRLIKVDSSDLSKTIPGAKFRIRAIDGSYGPEEFTTNGSGEIDLSMLPEGSYEVVEVECAGYVIDEAQRIIHLRANDTAEFVFTNTKKPGFKLIKTSADGSSLDGVTFRIARIENGSRYLDRTTANGGEISVDDLEPGIYSVQETATVPDHILDKTEYHVELSPGKVAELRLSNDKKPLLTLSKIDADDQKPIPNTVLTVKALDGTYQDDWKTGADGKVSLRVDPGVYQVTEKSVPSPYYIPDKDADRTQTITLGANDEKTLVFRNRKAPELTIFKENSITGEPIEHAKFHITYTSTGEAAEAPDTIDYGELFTNASGEIKVHEQGKRLYPGEFTITEVAPADGFQLKEPITQKVMLHGSESKTVRFQNTPLSALVVWKYDSVTKEPVEGAIFQVKYMSGTSGSGGTVIGTYKTGPGGSFTVNRLKAGAYLVEELASDGDHVMDTAPQTAYISGSEQDVVQLYFGNSPRGAVLIKKISASDHAPLSDVEFFITDSHGTMLGDANGKFVTDSAGTILISNLDPGTTVVARETRAKPGYLLDDVPQTATIKAGQTVTLEFRNQPKGSVTLYKFSSVDRKTPLEGVGFKITYADGRVVDNINGKLSSNGIYYTDSEGQINISGITGTLIFTEISTIPGYLIDENRKSQTIVVNPDDHQSVYFYNIPSNTLIIEKYLETESGNEPLKGVTFLVTDSSGAVIGNFNGEFISGEDGRVVIAGVVPGTTVNVREIKAPEGVVLDSQAKSIKIGDGGANVLRFYNKKTGYLVIRKLDSVTKQPLAGVEFELTYADGSYVDDDFGHLSSKGRFKTNDAGEIRVPVVGTVVVKEVKTLPTHVIDPATQIQTVQVNPADTQYITVYNEPLCSLTLTKKDAVTGKPVPGTEFTLKDGNGTILGRYTTGKDGTVTVTGLIPGSTVVVTETKVPNGYVLDPTPQTIIVKNGLNSMNSGTVGGTTNVTPGGTTNVGGGTNGGNDLVFENDPIGTFELIKVRESDKTKRIPNVTFEIRRVSDDALVETVVTGSDGRVSLKLDAGDYYAVEIECPKEFKLDSTRHYFTMKNGKNTTLTVTNKAFSGLVIHKIDSVTGKGIYGVSFLIYDSSQKPIDQVTTDQNGYIYLDSLDFSGKIFVREMENKGYIADTQLKTFYIKPGETTEITWKNTPIMGQIQIWKKSADDNPINGFPAGTPLEGAVFEIYDKASRLVDTVKSDKNGLAASKLLPLERYTVKEVVAPPYYAINNEAVTVYLEHEGQIVQIEVRDTSVFTNVSVHKSGYKEVVPGQSIRYQFSDVANNSTVPLDNFYWRDTLPTDAVRLDKIITGTWTGRLSYKVVYRTNASSEYRTLADNLNTSKSYTLDASAAALGLANNEYVTEVMFLFGRVPSGFTQLQAPSIYCKVLPGLAHEYRFANKTDVGGIWQGNWVMAVDRWVTIVYNKTTTPTLPRTGY